MRSIARILVVLMMCMTLPTQVLAGITMPFCGGAAADAPVAGHSEHAGHDMEGAMANTDVGHGQAHHASSDSNDCNQCGLCHLACAGALPTFLALAFSAPLESVLRAVLQTDTSDFLPDRLLRPPRAPLV